MDLKHFSCKLIQYLPILSASTATIVCAILVVFDVVFPDTSTELIKVIYEMLVVSFGFLSIYCFSKLFGYCLRQRIGIYYTYFFLVCMWLRRYPNGEDGVFGNYIEEAHILMLSFGLLYVVYVLIKVHK